MANMPKIVISGASVKVMRSYDYCHFEVSLSTVEDPPLVLVNINDGTKQLVHDLAPGNVDELRKEAMRLVDKAVEQYQISKRIMSDQLNLSYKRRRIIEQANEAENTPEDQRTPEQKAAIKTLEDYNFHMQFRYDYDDDWDSDDWEARQDALEG